jgi:regulatory protein
MATITAIRESARNPNRRSIHLDGHYALTVADAVVARLGLRQGLSLSPEQLDAVRRDQARQTAIDAGLRILQRRLHSRTELRRKLLQKKTDPDLADAALDELQRMGYVDDARFARTRAQAQQQYRHAGPRLALATLLKAGVAADTARAAIDEVYAGTDGTSDALSLAIRQRPRLLKLPPDVARRRLSAMLGRRGFDYETIKAVVDKVLGGPPADD